GGTGGSEGALDAPGRAGAPDSTASAGTDPRTVHGTGTAAVAGTGRAAAGAEPTAGGEDAHKTPADRRTEDAR
ncbi:hypothetical protein, partial [Streptomyces sp. CC53]|uniref:hypothetical protein n=1 Tax=Streptomyces sp. CC53 TaxID=1906740 RepID=UPI003528A409